MSKQKGGFTLPGEEGYEQLTLKMAEKWGADVIRDSDGTSLSPEILKAGYGIYSTVCIIREHNEWAKENLELQQQTFLMTQPVVAAAKEIKISVMADFFAEQFAVNCTKEAMEYWQVYDRTTNQVVNANNWEYLSNTQEVHIKNAQCFHSYTVSFLTYRIWEEISMYNHVTNHWNKEHLMQLDPRYPKVQDYMKNWMKTWCEKHPDTTVVRFTSLFYNFVWIWGSSEGNRSLYTDWGSYDFSVSPLALKEFAKQYGYELLAEDFINQGNLHVTHMPPTKKQRDWMEFINGFVIDFAKQLVDIVHRSGKKAYVFYDDSWVGLEPYMGNFHQFGFDGLIKCVFSGYEVRLCAGVDVSIHEIRLHPYLFPVGLGGVPTFAEGGHPKEDAQQYWNSVRRALLRVPIERIGLGGYLHLTENYPDFQDYIEKISDEFRLIQTYHASGKPYTLPQKVAVLHSWGKIRSWTLSGHFHETHQHDLIHIIEALAGLPLDVDFIEFREIRDENLERYDVIINAGQEKTAWSGGEEWVSEKAVIALTKWISKGGRLIGVQDPSAVEGYQRRFRMAEVLGVDKNTQERSCHGKWQFSIDEIHGLMPKGCSIPLHASVSLTDGKATVLDANGDDIKLSIYNFGKGLGVYMSGFEYSLPNTRLLLNLILFGTKWEDYKYLSSNANIDCAYFPNSNKLVLINNSNRLQYTKIETDAGTKKIEVEAYEQLEIEV